MTNFSTLFDHNYLSRGLTLYESLKQSCSDKFCLYILATSNQAYKWLKNNPHEGIIAASLSDIKKAYPVLRRLEKERSRAEFNWTLSSFSIQYFLKNFNLESVTYLDADMYFYADPKLLFDELNGESVIITPHNYTPKYDQTATSGRYCVQFMYFNNDSAGNEVLEWWRGECEKCCCGTPTDGKFGDQKYLDDWLTRFAGKVHEEKHLGCGIAPWNIQQFDLIEKDRTYYVQNKITGQKERLVFYHYHGLKEMKNEQGEHIWNLNKDYEYTDLIVEKIYKPYISKLEALNTKLPVWKVKKPSPLIQFALRIIHGTARRVKKLLRKN